MTRDVYLNRVNNILLGKKEIVIENKFTIYEFISDYKWYTIFFKDSLNFYYVISYYGTGYNLYKIKNRNEKPIPIGIGALENETETVVTWGMGDIEVIFKNLTANSNVKCLTPKIDINILIEFLNNSQQECVFKRRK